MRPFARSHEGRFDMPLSPKEFFMAHQHTTNFLSCLDALVETITLIVKHSPQSLYNHSHIRKIGNFKIVFPEPASFPFEPQKSSFAIINRLATLGASITNYESIIDNLEDNLQEKMKECGIEEGGLYLYDIAPYLVPDMYIKTPSAHEVMKIEQTKIPMMLSLLKKADEEANAMLHAWNEIPFLGTSVNFSIGFHVQNGASGLRLKTNLMIDESYLSTNQSNEVEIYKKTRKIFHDFLTSMEMIDKDATTSWILIKPSHSMKIEISKKSQTAHSVLGATARDAKLYHKILSHYHNNYPREKSAPSNQSFEASLNTMVCVARHEME